MTEFKILDFMCGQGKIRCWNMVCENPDKKYMLLLSEPYL